MYPSDPTATGSPREPWAREWKVRHLTLQGKMVAACSWTDLKGVIGWELKERFVYCPKYVVELCMSKKTGKKVLYLL